MTRPIVALLLVLSMFSDADGAPIPRGALTPEELACRVVARYHRAVRAQDLDGVTRVRAVPCVSQRGQCVVRDKATVVRVVGNSMAHSYTPEPGTPVEVAAWREVCPPAGTRTETERVFAEAVGQAVGDNGYVVTVGDPRWRHRLVYYVRVVGDEAFIVGWD